MKKNIVSLVAAVVASASMLCAAAVPAFAQESEDPGYVRQEVEYTAPDPYIIQMEATWEDEQGNKYSHKLIPQEEPSAPKLGSAKEEEIPDPIISAKVTWSDGAGNRFVNDGTTVTVYDSEGNVIAVMPA